MDIKFLGGCMFSFCIVSIDQFIIIIYKYHFKEIYRRIYYNKYNTCILIYIVCKERYKMKKDESNFVILVEF